MYVFLGLCVMLLFVLFFFKTVLSALPWFWGIPFLLLLALAYFWRDIMQWLRSLGKGQVEGQQSRAKQQPSAVTVWFRRCRNQVHQRLTGAGRGSGGRGKRI